jgi:SAM-dependent methyltransferase
MSSIQENFYKELEERFRGSRDVICNRLLRYDGFLNSWKDKFKQEEIKALDLGCGRGEWLDLLNNHGANVVGVDMNSELLASAKEKGHLCYLSDALSFVKSTPSESFDIVSMFHLAEHLEPSYLIELFSEINRIIKPHGIVIVETPNPENITVATNTFFLDPTHVKPIPPLLLDFMLSFAGFSTSSIIRHRDNPQNDLSIASALNAESYDYACIASKSEQALDEIFIQGKNSISAALAYDEAVRLNNANLLTHLKNIQSNLDLVMKLPVVRVSLLFNAVIKRIYNIFRQNRRNVK